MKKQYDVIVVGGGQSALATAYYLKKTGLDYIILDKEKTSGGAWLHAWDTLTLFSPADTSSLPGWLMPQARNIFPTKEEVLYYLSEYETRYSFNIHRPVNVLAIRKTGEVFEVVTEKETYYSKAV